MKTFFIMLATLCLSYAVAAEVPVEMETTRIKTNTELPKVLYVVPWKDIEGVENVDQKLVLHDFFGDLYTPVLPADLEQQDDKPVVQSDSQ